MTRLELALQGVATFNRCGVRAVAERHWHPDVAWHVFAAEVLDAVEGPEGVFVAVRLHGRGAGSGRPVKRQFWYAIEMDGRRERRIRVCGDPVEALDAVGLDGGRSSRLSYARRPRAAAPAPSRSARRSRARGCMGC